MKTLEGLGLLLGMIIGAGLFALPYSFLQSGIVGGSLLFVLILLVSWLLHSLYAAIIYITPGKHRFPGYIKLHLGERAETLAAIFTFLSYYGAMLAYGLLGAIFLETILGLDFFWGGILFFIAGGALFFLSLRSVAKINFYLTLPLLAFILILAVQLLPNVESGNFTLPSTSDFLLPYGVLLFAFGGYAALPDLHDVLGANRRKLSKKIILWSLIISALVYLIFILAVLGASGVQTTPDAFSGLLSTAGRSVVLIGSIIGILTVFTSYLVFGVDLKLTFRYDYKFSESISWILAFAPPLLLFALGFTNLIKILSLVGSVGLGIFAVFVLLISWREREKLSSFLGFTPRAWWLLPLGVLIVLGALQDILNL